MQNVQKANKRVLALSAGSHFVLDIYQSFYVGLIPLLVSKFGLSLFQVSLLGGHQHRSQQPVLPGLRPALGPVRAKEIHGPGNNFGLGFFKPAGSNAPLPAGAYISIYRQSGNSQLSSPQCSHGRILWRR
ncbi:MAG: hypothetical protein U5N58_02925 [Actinomycetota bacterium]|nr:hypothetical protein [Actinomycetota bacterium]